MLTLESARWGELEQAYGSAEDIPRLLASLGSAGDAERGELWFGLWGTLCREGEVYTASYAAAPHLVAFAGEGSAARAAEALHLVGAIDAGRVTAGAPPVPDDLLPPYRDALREVPRLIAARAEEPWDADTTQVLSAVLAIAKGHPRFGNAALQLEASMRCPICRAAHATAGWVPEGDS